MHNKLAHTAEHAFIGSLQKILGSTLTVRKVEHRESTSRVIVELQYLDLQTVVEAEREVNSVIQKGRKVKIHYFRTLDEARKHFPSLRANEERIKISNQSVRIIEIEGHDVAACALEHASNLRECEFFLITRVARAGGDSGYEIDFAVQTQAKEASLSFTRKILRICQSLGANTNTIEDTVKKMIEENRINAVKVKRLTSEHLSRIQPTIISQNMMVSLVQATLCGLDDEEIRSFVSKKISESRERTIFLTVNMPIENSEYSSFVFARTETLDQVNCKILLSKYSSLGVSGGGRPSFVCGIIQREHAEELINKLVVDVAGIIR